MSAANQIKTLRKKANLTLEQLAQLANTTKSQVSKLERGDRRLTVDWMMRLSKAMKCQPQDLLPEYAQDQDNVKPSGANGQQVTIDVPVYGTAGSSALEKVELKGQVQEYVARPSVLNGAQDAYALYIGDETMTPKFHPGDLVFVKPNAPVKNNNFAVVEKTDGEVFLAQVLTKSTTHILARRLNPLQDLVFEFGEIKTLDRVVASIEA